MKKDLNITKAEKNITHQVPFPTTRVLKTRDRWPHYTVTPTQK